MCLACHMLFPAENSFAVPKQSGGDVEKKNKTTQPVTSRRLYVTALPGTEGKKIPMLSSCRLGRAFPAPSARQKRKACCDLDLGSLLLFIREVSSRQGAGEEPGGKKSCWSSKVTRLESCPPVPPHSPSVSLGDLMALGDV